FELGDKLFRLLSFRDVPAAAVQALATFKAGEITSRPEVFPGKGQQFLGLAGTVVGRSYRVRRRHGQSNRAGWRADRSQGEVELVLFHVILLSMNTSSPLRLIEKNVVLVGAGN